MATNFTIGIRRIAATSRDFPDFYHGFLKAVNCITAIVEQRGAAKPLVVMSSRVVHVRITPEVASAFLTTFHTASHA